MTDLPPDAPAEPLISVGSVTAVVTAGLAAAVTFGFKLTDAQTAAILAIVGVVAPLVVAVWGRSKVYSPATVRKLLARKS